MSTQQKPGGKEYQQQELAKPKKQSANSVKVVVG